MIKNRLVAEKLYRLHYRSRGRMIVLTGARQTGKTTLVKKLFPDHFYISMEDPTVRAEFEYLSAEDWINRHPVAIIDEIQKLPSLFEVIKAAYDKNENTRYVLLGSSQILLLKKIRESLAGRIAIQELFPLTLSEMRSSSWDDTINENKLITWLNNKSKINPYEFFCEELSSNTEFSKTTDKWEYFLRFGGMPALLTQDFIEEDKHLWLHDYQQTYLQRDLSDLARLERLEPFVRAQKAIASKNATTINFSDLARLSDVTVYTAKNFLRYLELSYQVITVPAFFANQEKRLSKMPKIFFLDPGISRGILQKRGDISGEEFEAAVVSEIYKQIRTAHLPVSFYHLRTTDGREIDLLLELEDGFVAIECKMTRHVAQKDFKHFKGLEQILKKPLIMGLVISNEPRVSSWNKSGTWISAPPGWILG